jgi:diguanylate cyclase (GGDEF)-like protein
MPATRLPLADWLWGVERKTRIRLQQWSVTFAIYTASAVAMGAGVAVGWLPLLPWLGWCGFVGGGLGLFYAAIRSGWSQRYADGALTEWQTGFGVLAVCWGYAMCGHLRSATLLSMMVILTFGAFSMDWRRQAALTAFALTAFAATITAMHRLGSTPLDLRLDIANFAIAAIMLPASSVVAGLMGALRRRLHQQRGEVEAALARIHELAHQDDLTGLPNRRQAQRLLEQERTRVARSGRGFAIAMVDIDHFKRINDVHGHDAGDRALHQFAQHASAALRANDVVARWGGEEFLLLMPETRLADALEALERLRRHVQQGTLHEPAAELRLTVSCGVAESAPGESVADLVARADRALYIAKRQGRNRVIGAPPQAAAEAAALSPPAEAPLRTGP